MADYLLQYKGDAKELLLEEMSREIEVSQPTIMRFVKAAGYSGFKDFKYAMMQEEAKSTAETEDRIGLYGFRILKQDKLEEIPGKIITTSSEMLNETLKSLDIKEYCRAVEAILNAENIVIYGVENSVSVANDLLTKLTYLGLNCRMYGDYYLQAISAMNLTRKDLAVGISYSGCSRHTVDMMATAKKSGAKTLVMTNFEDSLICKYADIRLCSSNQQFLYGDAIFSRITQLALVDMLYAGVMNRDYSKLCKKLNQAGRAVTQRAYGHDEEVL